MDLGLKDLWVRVGTMELCNANVIIDYDGRRSGPPSAPLEMVYDSNRTEGCPPIHNPYSRTPLRVYQ